jgi:adenosine deaminase
MARNSLEHSFLQGGSLWQGDFRMVSACATDQPQKERLSSICRKLLDASEKAEIQWQLEKKFENFEEKY